MNLNSKVTLLFAAIAVGILVMLVAISLYAFRSYSISSSTSHVRTAAEVVRVHLTEAMIQGTIEHREQFLSRLMEVQGLTVARVIRSPQVDQQYGAGLLREMPADEIERAVLAGLDEAEMALRQNEVVAARQHAGRDRLLCHQSLMALHPLEGVDEQVDLGMFGNGVSKAGQMVEEQDVACVEEYQPWRLGLFGSDIARGIGIVQLGAIETQPRFLRMLFEQLHGAVSRSRIHRHDFEIAKSLLEKAGKRGRQRIHSVVDGNHDGKERHSQWLRRLCQQKISSSSRAARRVIG